MDSKEIELLAALVTEMHGIRQAVEAIASVQAPAPNITRPMSDWPNAREILENLGATVAAEDKSGPTRAEYQGRIYVRRSAHDDEGEKSDAIWFSATLSGTVKDGNVKWGRLVTFRNRKTDTLPNGAKTLKFDAPQGAPAPVRSASPRAPMPQAVAAAAAGPTLVDRRQPAWASAYNAARQCGKPHAEATQLADNALGGPVH